MNFLKRALHAIDDFQQSHAVPAFIFAVTKKFGDDEGGSLVVQLTYSMFVTVFPLLLLLVTVLGLVLANDPSARHQVVNSAFGEFPIIGQQLSSNIHALERGSPFGLVVGLLGLAYGSTGLAQTGLYTMGQIWNVPLTSRPGFLARMLRSLLFLVVLAVGLAVTTVLSGFGTFGRHNPWLGALAELVAALANVGFYLAAFRVLTHKPVATRSLLPGAVVGGVVWTILQAAGGYVVGHQLRGASATYGMFGLVLGLLAWIYLGAKTVLYAAEVNAVLHRHLWPRSLVQPPLTAADRESLRLQVLQQQRRPEQHVVSEFAVDLAPTDAGRPPRGQSERGGGREPDTVSK